MTEENKVNGESEQPTPEEANPKKQEAPKPEEQLAEKQPPEQAAKQEAPAAPAKEAAAPKAAEAPAVKPAAAKPAVEKPAAAKADAPAAEQKPDPKKEAAQQVLDRIRTLLIAKFGEDAVAESALAKYQPTFVIKREQWFNVAEFLRHDAQLLFDYPEVMAGTDYPDKGYIEVAVYLYSMKFGQFITIKVQTPRDNAEVASLVPLYNGLNWEEREIYDLLGVKFQGHPNLTRIMMPDDYEGHPLRKDFSVWEE